MIRENFHDLTHFYMSMDDQTRGTGCVHSKASGSAGFMPNFHVESPDLGITGTPCQPFSRQRVKRSAPGSVAGHKAYETTFTDLVCWLHSFEPKVAIVSRWRGWTSASLLRAQHRPCSSRLVGKRLCPKRQILRSYQLNAHALSFLSFLRPSDHQVCFANASSSLATSRPLCPWCSLRPSSFIPKVQGSDAVWHPCHA